MPSRSPGSQGQRTEFSWTNDPKEVEAVACRPDSSFGARDAAEPGTPGVTDTSPKPDDDPEAHVHLDVATADRQQLLSQRGRGNSR